MLKKQGTVPAGDIYVDGNKIGDVDNLIMKERKIMSNDGIVIVIINTKNNKLITKPSIATRGFVVVNDNQELLHELENYVEKVIINSKNNDIKPLVINELSDYIFTKTGRKPIIMPVIMEIKKTH